MMAQLRRLIAYAVVLQDRKSGHFPTDFTAKSGFFRTLGFA
jgi:hypothetical protein